MFENRLWTRSYIFVCIAGFLTSFSFFLLVPTLPFYLSETFNISPAAVGAVLSCYVIAVLCVRPFAGCVADSYPRKKVYIISYILFATAFCGYLGFARTLPLFIILRVFHGFAFGSLSTTANTLVIDIMPSSRRGEGLGYYGVMNNLAMAFGPMTGLFVMNSYGFDALFAVSLTAAVVGLVFASMVRSAYRAPSPNPTKVISIDRFFLVAGVPASIVLFLLAVPYGITSSYMALYAADCGITAHSGLFFTVMAMGLIISRLNSGKRVDKGYITQTIRRGFYLVVCGVVGEALLATMASINVSATNVLYFLSALCFGYGFGTMFPAFNTLFVNLAPNSRRATANATYLTGWDVGIGSGMLLGGALSEFGFSVSFIFGVVLVITAMVLFIFYVTPHFERHRLR